MVAFTTLPLEAKVSVGYTPRMTPDQFNELRRRAGLTQAEAAKWLGVTRVTVARWETGMRAIPEPTVRLWVRLVAEVRAKGRSGRGQS
jgi:DNA-binding transcriptional regulator YiaG